MQCRPSDDDVRVVILARDRTRESENAAAAVKDGVRALRRKGARTKSEVVFYFCLLFLFVGQKYVDLFSYPICPAIKGLLQSKEFCCNLKICIPFLKLLCVGGILQSNLLP